MSNTYVTKLNSKTENIKKIVIEVKIEINNITNFATYAEELRKLTPNGENSSSIKYLLHRLASIIEKEVQ